MAVPFKNRKLDVAQPMRCGMCAYHKHWKVFDKPCQDLGVGDRDKICTEFVASSRNWSQVQRMSIVEVLSLMNRVGLTNTDLHALLYGMSKEAGRAVYVEHRKGQYFQGVILARRHDKYSIMHTGTGTISLVDESALLFEPPANADEISTDAFVNKQEHAPTPGRRGRRKKGEETKVPDAIMNAVRESLDDSPSVTDVDDKEDDGEIDGSRQSFYPDDAVSTEEDEFSEA